MNEIFLKVSKLRNKIQQDIEQIYIQDRFKLSQSDQNTIQKKKNLLEYNNQIRDELQNYNEQINILYNLLDQSGIENRTIWNKRIQSLESSELINDLNKAFKFQEEQIRIAYDKSRLFGYVQESNKKQDNQGVQILIKEQELIQRANHEASGMIEAGQNILLSFNNQGHSLKRIKTRVLTILNNIGLSNTLTNLIQKRSTNDFYLLIFLLVSLVLFIFILYYYVRPLVRSY